MGGAGFQPAVGRAHHARAGRPHHIFILSMKNLLVGGETRTIIRGPGVSEAMPAKRLTYSTLEEE
jgi:hypothetical protein